MFTTKHSILQERKVKSSSTDRTRSIIFLNILPLVILVLLASFCLYAKRVEAATFSGAYSWWIYPISLSTSPTTTLLDYVKDDGKQSVVEVDTNGDIIGETELYGSYSKDEHNAPAIIKLSDGGILWAWAGHGTQSKNFYYKSADGSLPSAPIVPNELITSAKATYAQLFTRESDVYWFYRTSNTAWSLRRSTDNADTWGSEQVLLSDVGPEQMYISGRKTDLDTIRLFVTNNGGTANNHVWVMKINLIDGDISTGSGSLGNLNGTSLPIARSEITSILDAPANYGVRLLDVKDDGSAFVYALYDLDDNPFDSTYFIARLTGNNPYNPSNWTHTEIVDSGVSFYTASHYFGGVVFTNESHSGLRLYISRESNGTWYIERWDSAAGDGSDWITTQLASDANNLLLRPISPIDALSNFPVYWQSGPSYSTYQIYDLSVVAEPILTISDSQAEIINYPSSGGSIMRRVNNLLAMGNKKLAQELIDQWPYLFKTDASTTTKTIIKFARDLNLRETGDDIRRLQQFLNAQGFIVSNTGPGSPGNETTYFGQKTFQAVVRFQEMYADQILFPLNLKWGTGFVGSKTREKLNELMGSQ